MEMKSARAAEGSVTPGRAAIAATDQYLNRELSLLEFNQRVLAQAEDVTLPLLERLRFLCIVSSNIDEFFEVRVASLLAQHKIDTAHGDLSGLFAATLEHVSTEARRLITRQYALLYNNEILPQLAQKEHIPAAPQRPQCLRRRRGSSATSTSRCGHC